MTTGGGTTPFATVTDLEDLTRPLGQAERARVELLLDMCAILIRRRITVDPGDAEQMAIARFVSLDMVEGALGLSSHRGKVSYSSTVGGIAESATLLNPAVTLALMNWHLALFGDEHLPATAPHWRFD